LDKRNDQRLALRSVAAVAIGNALEFYDFLTFSFFAVQIGHSFFPVSQTQHGLLYTLATFGVGFLARPLGGVVIGRYADRAGRKPAMILSFTMMGVAITGLALTPGYATIGVAAPILLVVYRLIQGFALGGEVGPSSAFLIEAAPPHRRGLYLSLQAATQYLAILAAGLMGFVLAAILPDRALDVWGWRVAFLVGATIVPFGIALRAGLQETLQKPEGGVAPGQRATLPVRLIILSLLMLGSGTIGTYSLDYMAVYAQDTLNMPANLAFGATVVSGVIGIVACVLAGMLADRIGRKPIMLTAVAVQILLVVPAFIAINVSRSATTMYAAVAVLGTAQNFTDVPVLMLITQSLPKSIRAGSLSIIYATAIAVFGGSTQFVVKALIDATGNPLAPAWFMTGALVMGAAAMLQMREIGEGEVAGPVIAEAGSAR
jgi:MFS transporter, MHS family, citrate/tricarballylate:H+ symporter